MKKAFARFLTILLSVSLVTPARSAPAVATHMPKFTDLMNAYYCKSLQVAFKRPETVTPEMLQKMPAELWGTNGVSSNAVDVATSTTTNATVTPSPTTSTEAKTAPTTPAVKPAPTTTPTLVTTAGTTNATTLSNLTSVVATAGTNAQLSLSNAVVAAAATVKLPAADQKLDPQSKSIRDRCDELFAKHPAWEDEFTAEELSDALAKRVKAERREFINEILASLQDDFVNAEYIFPYAPELLWVAIGRLYGDFQKRLGPYLTEQAQRKKNGKADPILQYLHGAFIVFSVTKGSQIGFKTVRSGYFGWKTLGPTFAEQSTAAMKLMFRSFGDGLRRLVPTRKRVILWGRGIGRTAKVVGLKAYNVIRHPLTSTGKGISTSYEYFKSAAANNSTHLAIASMAGVSWEVHKLLQEEIISPVDFLDEAVAAGVDGFYNEWTLLRAISKAKTKDEALEILKKHHASVTFETLLAKMVESNPRVSFVDVFDRPKFEVVRKTMEAKFIEEFAKIKNASDPIEAKALKEIMARYYESLLTETSSLHPELQLSRSEVELRIPTALELDDLPALKGQTLSKLNTLSVLANGRNLNLPFDLMLTDLRAAEETMKTLGLNKTAAQREKEEAAKKAAEPAKAAAQPSSVPVQDAAATVKDASTTVTVASPTAKDGATPATVAPTPAPKTAEPTPSTPAKISDKSPGDVASTNPIVNLPKIDLTVVPKPPLKVVAPTNSAAKVPEGAGDDPDPRHELKKEN
jgi:hypothetical protein